MKKLKKYFVVAALAWFMAGLMAVAIWIIVHRCSEEG
jgi:hypothetical protein